MRHVTKAHEHLADVHLLRQGPVVPFAGAVILTHQIEGAGIGLLDAVGTDDAQVHHPEELLVEFGEDLAELLLVGQLLVGVSVGDDLNGHGQLLQIGLDGLAGALGAQPSVAAGLVLEERPVLKKPEARDHTDGDDADQQQDHQQPALEALMAALGTKGAVGIDPA